MRQEGHEIAILEGALRSIVACRIRQIIAEVAPPGWERANVSLGRGVSVLRQTAATGNFRAFAFPNRYERLGVGLGAAKNVYAVGNMSEVVDWEAFVRDRIAKSSGSNLVFLAPDVAD